MKSIARSHFIAALLSFTLLLVTLGGLWLFTNRIDAREQQVFDARDRLASYEQNKAVIAEEQVKLEAIRTHITDLQQHVFSDDTTPTLLSSVENLAQRDGLDFTITTVTATTTPEKLHIDFSSDGGFANQRQFIADLLSQAYEVQMTKLSLYLTDASSGTGKVGSWQLLGGFDVISF